MKFSKYLPILLLTLAACSGPTPSKVKLSDFQESVPVKSLGARLIELPMGMQSLESNLKNANQITVAVHGGSSEGYEWVYPLKTLDTPTNEIYFYRWADNGCYKDSGDKLIAKLENLLSQNTQIQKVILIGHSYGGILVTHLLNNWKNTVTLDAHIIASPLQGNTSLNTLCGYKPTINVGPMTHLYEWRTQKHLDSAFKDLPENPQNIYIEGSIVTELPETYNGRRLGHNWSISWVAERISK
jgi:pimeloyl-ACP methyl ester carboxylesterase